MVFATQNQRSERRAICAKCKHYRKSTDSCGTLAVASLTDPLPDQSKPDQKLCGCVIRIKSKFILADCPLQKWPKLIFTHNEIEELKSVVDTIGKGVVSPEDEAKLSPYYKKLTGFELGNNCNACAQNFVKDAKTQLQSL